MYFVHVPPTEEFHFGHLQVRSPGETEMRDVEIPAGVKALVVLNLQSYAGGRDLFGLRTRESSLHRRGYQQPIFNDGLLEVLLKISTAFLEDCLC